MTNIVLYIIKDKQSKIVLSLRKLKNAVLMELMLQSVGKYVQSINLFNFLILIHDYFLFLIVDIIVLLFMIG